MVPTARPVALTIRRWSVPFSASDNYPNDACFRRVDVRSRRAAPMSPSARTKRRKIISSAAGSSSQQAEAVFRKIAFYLQKEMNASMLRPVVQSRFKMQQQKVQRLLLRSAEPPAFEALVDIFAQVFGIGCDVNSAGEETSSTRAAPFPASCTGTAEARRHIENIYPGWTSFLISRDPLRYALTCQDGRTGVLRPAWSVGGNMVPVNDRGGGGRMEAKNNDVDHEERFCADCGCPAVLRRKNSVVSSCPSSVWSMNGRRPSSQLSALDAAALLDPFSSCSSASSTPSSLPPSSSTPSKQSSASVWNESSVALGRDKWVKHLRKPHTLQTSYDGR